ncbi:MAG: hypothetical protein Q7U04_03770 [Bacteriovorax sp.]|nr:hypothetical protein [Bacteriovorax sp.]
MKKNLIIIILIFTPFSLFAANGGRASINSSSWSLLYGYSQNVNNLNYKPAGASYKFQFGTRWDSNVEINFFGRYTSQKDNISFSNIDGSITRADQTAGIHFGYWLFSVFNLHAGYALHNNSHKIAGAYSSTQSTTIKSNYNLGELNTKGLLAGADLVLLQSTSFQLFTNYEYYHLNHLKSHDWEAMVGIRFYPGPSKNSSSSSSFFNKFFEWVFAKDGK